MDDKQLVELFLERSEKALAETTNKYGAYCRYIADNILDDKQDSEECVQDALTAAWNSIPPQKPKSLKAYLARLTRNLAINIIKKKAAQKRGGDARQLALDELRECALPETPETQLDAKLLKELIDRFLQTLSKKQRTVFLKRYWFLCTPEKIASECAMSVSAVNTMLSRTRKQLKKFLTEEGFDV